MRYVFTAQDLHPGPYSNKYNNTQQPLRVAVCNAYQPLRVDKLQLK